MFILKNALTSIKRNIGRNILIGIIILVISCALTVTLAIKNTSSRLIASYEEANDITATITFNRGNMMEKYNPENSENFENMKEEFSSLTSLTSEEIKTYANTSYVKSYYYTSSIGVNSDIEPATSNFSFEGKGNNNKRGFGNSEASSNFTLIGYSDILAMQEFINGDYTLSDYDEDIWNKILDGNYCLINSELAILNNLSVGDTLEVIDPTNEDNAYTLTILGIFTENSSNEEEISLFSSSVNTIITNTNLLEEIENNSEELQVTLTPYFILNNKDDVEDFQEELYTLGLNENYVITTNESEIASATSSVSNVATFATTFLIITLIIGAIVLFIINCINIRERKYEIGVLRTIGMKKSLLASQFILELVIVSFVGLILGAGLGTVLAKPVSNSLLSSEINKTQENIQNISDNFGGRKENNEDGKIMNTNNLNFNKIGGIANVEAFDSINAVVDFKVILELIGMCLLLTVISSCASITSIIRFRPLDILKERN